MTDREIVLLAQEDVRNGRRTVLPDDIDALDALLYREIYFLCRDFDDGKISKEAARKLKTQYIDEYGKYNLKRRVYVDHAQRMVEISQLLNAAEHSGCEYCKRIAQIFDGRSVNGKGVG